MTLHKRFLLGALVFVAVAGILTSIVLYTGGVSEEAVPLVKIECEGLAAALIQYRAEAGDFPEQRKVIETLSGSNKVNKMFLYEDDWEQSETGRILDPWGTPFRIRYLNNECVRVVSAGANRRFGDKDDVKTK